MLRFPLLLCFLANVRGDAYDRGIIQLDNITFDKIVGQLHPTFVRIDKEYTYGDADDAFRELAKTVGESSAKVLVCTVGVADPPSKYRGEGEYGEPPPPEDDEEEAGYRDQMDLAERFEVDPESFPKFFFFPLGWTRDAKPKPYEGEHTKDGFMRFLQEEAKVWIGLPGQTKALHELAQSFVAASAEQRATLIKEAKAEGSSDSAYYAKVMEKLQADDGFIGKETARLKKMVSDGSVSAVKKEQFSRRLNSLSSFEKQS